MPRDNAALVAAIVNALADPPQQNKKKQGGKTDPAFAVVKSTGQNMITKGNNEAGVKSLKEEYGLSNNVTRTLAKASSMAVSGAITHACRVNDAAQAGRVMYELGTQYQQNAEVVAQLAQLKMEMKKKALDASAVKVKLLK